MDRNATIYAVGAVVLLYAIAYFPCSVPTRYVHPVQSLVRYQSTCGACWAHATAAALEMRHASGPVDDLDLIRNVPGNFGCSGGTIVNAYKYSVAVGFLCNATRRQLGSWRDLAGSSVCNIKKEIYLRGPVSAHVLEYGSMRNSDMRTAWTPYPGEKILGGHAVVIVGWDDVLGGWIIQNSWGPDWGHEGRACFAYGAASIESLFVLAGDL